MPTAINLIPAAYLVGQALNTKPHVTIYKKFAEPVVETPLVKISDVRLRARSAARAGAAAKRFCHRRLNRESPIELQCKSLLRETAFEQEIPAPQAVRKSVNATCTDSRTNSIVLACQLQGRLKFIEPLKSWLIS
jgi:hypothetical protein